MRPVRLYDNPEQFAEMMMGQLSEGMGVHVRNRKDEPLLLEISLDPVDPKEKVQVSLHNTYRSYMIGGDLNAAIDYLNNIVRTSSLLRDKEDVLKLDRDFIFPAIRDERYVEEAGVESPFLSEPYLPGLRIVYLDIKDGCTKIINDSLLQGNAGFTADKVKKFAYRNLRDAGWQSSRLVLQSPFRESCTVEVFMDNPHPIDCQFLLPDMAAPHMPDNCVIAYTNRQHILLMHSEERMNTARQVRHLVDKSGLGEVVKRSFYLMPGPVSMSLYWVRNGEAKLLEAA